MVFTTGKKFLPNTKPRAASCHTVLHMHSPNCNTYSNTTARMHMRCLFYSSHFNTWWETVVRQMQQKQRPTGCLYGEKGDSNIIRWAKRIPQKSHPKYALTVPLNAVTTLQDSWSLQSFSSNYTRHKYMIHCSGSLRHSQKNQRKVLSFLLWQTHTNKVVNPQYPSL